MAAISAYLGDILTTARSNRIIPIQGSKLRYKSEDLLSAPFGASSFDKSADATRLNFDIRADSAAEAFFERVDAWCIKALTDRSENIWGKALSIEKVQDMYTSTLKRPEGRPPLVRAKIFLEGRKSCGFWTPDGKLREMPSDWRGVNFRVNLELSHVWLMNNTCGIVINAVDCEIHDATEPERSSPF